MMRLSYKSRGPGVLLKARAGPRHYATSWTLVDPPCTRNVVSKTRFVAKKAIPCTLVYPIYDPGPRLSHQQPVVYPVYPPFKRVHRNRVWAEEVEDMVWAEEMRTW